MHARIPAIAAPEPARAGLTPALVLGALATQARVVNALILRDTKTRYGNHKIGFLWALIEPAVSVTIFVAIFAAFRQSQPGGMPLVPYMMMGILGFGLFRETWNRMQGAIESSRTLLAFPQVTTFDVILARGLLEVAVGLFTIGFLLYMAFLLGHDIRVEHPLGVLAVLGLLAMLGLGMGFLFAGLSPLVPSVNQLTAQALGRPLYFSSGLFFHAETLPPQVRDYLLWNPVLHMTELLRSEFFEGFETLYGSWSYAILWSLSSLALGLLVHQAVGRRAVSAR